MTDPETPLEAESKQRVAAWPDAVANSRKGPYDPRLVAMARAADAGDECPRVRLMTPNGTVVGRPGPSLGFSEEMRGPLKAEFIRDGHEPQQEIPDHVANLLHVIHERAATDGR